MPPIKLNRTRFKTSHKQTGSHVESETQRPLEFERKLEEVILRSKKIQDLMASIQWKMKLMEEVNARKLVEAKFQKKKAEVSNLHKELGKVKKEKEALEATVTDLTSNTALMKEFCSYHEYKLKVYDENFSKMNSLLSQALSNHADFGQKLKSLEEIHNGSGISATQKNLEFEDLIRASNEVAENASLKEELDSYRNAKKELESVIVQLEEQLKVQKANEDALKSEIEDLKADIAEKSALQVHLKELEEKLATAEAKLKEEEKANYQKDSEKEADVKVSLETMKKEIILLDNQVKEIRQKLQLAEAKLLEMEHKDGTEIKSRDIGTTSSTQTKRKSKKKLEAASAQTSSSSEKQAQTAFKVIYIY